MFRRTVLILSWGLYDLANQFFTLNIISLYFIRWLTLERKVPEFFYSIAFGVSTLVVAITSPALGAISDATKRRMPFLIPLTLLSVVFTMALGINNILLALLFFIVANYGCQAAVIFYNALLPDIAPAGKIGLVSGIGRMLAYIGAILAVYLMQPVVSRNGYRAAFLPTGILFFIFSLPCMIFIKDKVSGQNCRQILRVHKGMTVQAFSLLKDVLFSADSTALANFMKSAFFGISAVNVIILFMSVYVTKVYKLSELEFNNMITFSTLFAIAASFIAGYLSDRIGSRIGLVGTFILWGFSFTFGCLAQGMVFYWITGALVGISMGATWVLWRTMAVRLIPQERIGEMFGLFNLVSYLASITGSIFWGLVTIFFSGLGELGMRLAIFSLNFFIVLGLIFILRVPETG